MGRGENMTSRGSFARRAATALMSKAVRVMPAGRAPWATAMQNEMSLIDSDRDALRWAIGCLFANLAERISHEYGGTMNRQKINNLSAVIPVVMSTLALLTVLTVIITGWERHTKDEGAAAHIFQILIAAQLPFVLAFLVTANWKRGLLVARPLAFQFLAIGLALGSVALFRL
jgi:hypothetical protein